MGSRKQLMGVAFDRHAAGNHQGAIAGVTQVRNTPASAGKRIGSPEQGPVRMSMTSWQVIPGGCAHFILRGETWKYRVRTEWGGDTNGRRKQSGSQRPWSILNRVYCFGCAAWLSSKTWPSPPSARPCWPMRWARVRWIMHRRQPRTATTCWPTVRA